MSAIIQSGGISSTAFFDQISKGRQASPDPSIVADATVFQRDIEISPHEYALSVCIDIFYSFLHALLFLLPAVKESRLLEDDAEKNLFLSNFWKV